MNIKPIEFDNLIYGHASNSPSQLARQMYQAPNLKYIINPVSKCIGIPI